MILASGLPGLLGLLLLQGTSVSVLFCWLLLLLAFAGMAAGLISQLDQGRATASKSPPLPESPPAPATSPLTKQKQV